MGRPAFSWRVTPGDHGTEGSENPPTMVTAPSGEITTHRIDQIAKTPRGCMGPTLSRSCRTNMTAYNGCSTNRPRQKSRHHTKHKGRIDQNIDHTHHHCPGPFPGGGRRGRGRTQTPPTTKLQETTTTVCEEAQLPRTSRARRPWTEEKRLQHTLRRQPLRAWWHSGSGKANQPTTKDDHEKKTVIQADCSLRHDPHLPTEHPQQRPFTLLGCWRLLTYPMLFSVAKATLLANNSINQRVDDREQPRQQQITNRREQVEKTLQSLDYDSRLYQLIATNQVGQSKDYTVHSLITYMQFDNSGLRTSAYEARHTTRETGLTSTSLHTRTQHLRTQHIPHQQCTRIIGHQNNYHKPYRNAIRNLGRPRKRDQKIKGMHLASNYVIRTWID